MVRTALFLFLLILAGACDPCRDCGPLTYEPTVALIFVDAELDEDEEIKETIASDVTIFWAELAAEIPFEEGLKEFDTPLSNSTNGSTYSIGIGEASYQLALTYEVFRELDVDRRMLVRAQNIQAESHSFDSLVFSCNTVDCLDKETTITCYF